MPRRPGHRPRGSGCCGRIIFAQGALVGAGEDGRATTRRRSRRSRWCRQGTATTLAEGLELEAAGLRPAGRRATCRAPSCPSSSRPRRSRRTRAIPRARRRSTVAKLGVLGAGLMGAGIAGVAAEAGVPVRLKDATTRGARPRAQATCAGSGRSGGGAASLTRLEVGHRLDRISPTLDYSRLPARGPRHRGGLRGPRAEAAVLAETEAATRDDCVFATNTSSIPIGEIAAGCARGRRGCWGCTSSRPSTRCRCSR